MCRTEPKSFFTSTILTTLTYCGYSWCQRNQLDRHILLWCDDNFQLYSCTLVNSQGHRVMEDRLCIYGNKMNNTFQLDQHVIEAVVMTLHFLTVHGNNTVHVYMYNNIFWLKHTNMLSVLTCITEHAHVSNGTVAESTDEITWCSVLTLTCLKTVLAIRALGALYKDKVQDSKGYNLTISYCVAYTYPLWVSTVSYSFHACMIIIDYVPCPQVSPV